MKQLKQLLTDRYNWWKSAWNSSDPKQARLARIVGIGWLCALVFFPGLYLSERSLASILVPGSFFSWPGLDDRERIEVHLPVRDSSKYAATPQYIYLDMEVDEGESFYYHFFQRVFRVLADGRLLKKPGEDFIPSDDLVLKLLPEVQLRAVWKQGSTIVLDLVRQSLPKQELPMKEFFDCLWLTLENNPVLKQHIQGTQLKFTMNGIPVERVIERAKAKQNLKRAARFSRIRYAKPVEEKAAEPQAGKPAAADTPSSQSPTQPDSAPATQSQ
jgi:hypothetical protein